MIQELDTVVLGTMSLSTVLTLTKDEIRPMGHSEIFHVRELAPPLA